MESNVSDDESDTTTLNDLVKLVHEQKGMLKKQALVTIPLSSSTGRGATERGAAAGRVRESMGPLSAGRGATARRAREDGCGAATGGRVRGRHRRPSVGSRRRIESGLDELVFL
jgi:hypothetical protein